MVNAKTWARLASGEVAMLTPAPSLGTWGVMDQRKTGVGGDYSCGPTSVTTVLVGTGHKIPGYTGPTQYGDAVANLRKMSGTTSIGTGSDGMQRALLKYGAKDQMTKSTDQALAAVRVGRPVILNGFSKDLYWLGGAPGHYIVVKGYDAKTGRCEVLDPWNGKRVITDGATLTRFGNSASDPNPHGWRMHHIVS